jgi:peptidoglycan/xylan/chitin deacetylase (PgdA/CDA1 family)
MVASDMHFSDRKGTLLISLDFELYWGVQDVISLNEYQNHLLGVHDAIPQILELFSEYKINATWATIGFLYFKDFAALQNNFPQQLPSYTNPGFSPYNYISNLVEKKHEKLYFAPKLIELIQQYPGQEIGTHTFSHYYCLEDGQTETEFKADLDAAIQVADQAGISTKSLVFPRNQYNKSYLKIVQEAGIKCFRGNEKHRIYNSINGDYWTFNKRSQRVLDSYINISGYNCYSIEELKGEFPIDIPASRFLRPYSPKLKYFRGLQIRRITSALSHAAKENSVYHLWWHPHNFGTNLQENLKSLRQVLEFYAELRDKNKMQSLNMLQLADILNQEVNPTQEIAALNTPLAINL